jgi:microcystin-dependent protein
MALETGTYISSLNASNPASTDGLAQADDHIRLLKSTIKATLPNVTGAITSSHTELNVLDGVTASTSEINKLDGLTATTAQMNTLATGGGVIPSGGIIMWSGAVSAIPSGWVLCNGSNSTPDLRNRFVVGAGSTYAVNATGGSDSVTLSTANLPAHNHSFSGSGTTNTEGDHTHPNVAKPHPFDSGRDGDSGSNSVGLLEGQTLGNSTGAAGSHNHTVTISGTTGNTGDGTAHENRPPYYALAYIMKT